MAQVHENLAGEDNKGFNESTLKLLSSMHLKTIYFSTILAYFVKLSLRRSYFNASMTTVIMKLPKQWFLSLLFRLVQNIRDRYWKSGGIYEFSAATKTRLKMLDASLLTYNSLFAVQPDVLEPLLSYW